MTRTLHSSIALVLAAVGVACCATVGASVEMTAQATGSAYFALGAPRLYGEGPRLRAVGRVCRRSRTTQLSPSRVRLEHVGAAGQIVDVAHASVPTIYRNADQACATYAASLGWTIAEGEIIRACFEKGRACPVDPAFKTTIVAPAPASTPPTP